MDAIKFIKERQRMCRFYGHDDNCYQCPAKYCECSTLEYMADDNRVVDIVEKWSEEHPAKTRQSVFLEQYPEARIRSNGVLSACPAIISAAYRADDGGCLNSSKGCDDCCHEFWMQEVE